MLQWSHALTSVETSTALACILEIDPASMEPRSNKRGNALFDMRVE